MTPVGPGTRLAMTQGHLGTFHKVPPSVLDDDPFWSAVRRRHPDVDIVLLPPDTPDHAAPRGQASGPDAVRAAVDAAFAAWTLLRPLAGATGSAEADAPPSVRWDLAGCGHALVVQKALRGLGRDRGAALLREVAFALGRDGWRLRPSSRSGRPVLEAVDGPVRLRAEAGPGATVLTVSTDALLLSDGERGAVVERLREAVATWQ